MVNISERIIKFNFKAWRENQKLTRAQAATLLGIAFQTYSRYEEEARAPMACLVFMCRVIDVLGHMRKYKPQEFVGFVEAWNQVSDKLIDQAANACPAGSNMMRKARMRQKRQQDKSS